MTIHILQGVIVSMIFMPLVAKRDFVCLFRVQVNTATAVMVLTAGDYVKSLAAIKTI